MATRDVQFINKANFHRLIAMVFLVLLLVEWGSHGLAFSHSYSLEGQAQAIGFDEQGHEDPCKTMVHGTDGTRPEKPVPNLGHDVTQANAFFAISAIELRIGLRKDPRLSHAQVNGLFRPVSPPFHPPELS